MATLTSDELEQSPGRLLDDARRGTSDVVTADGEPVMLTLTLGITEGTGSERLEMAIALYDRDQNPANCAWFPTPASCPEG